jgi:hypothetical protein
MSEIRNNYMSVASGFLAGGMTEPDLAKIQGQMETFFQENVYARQFLGGINPPTIPHAYADPCVLNTSGCDAYILGGTVYTTTDPSPDALIHEYRHIFQRQRIGAQKFDRLSSPHDFRRWLIFKTAIETEATVFEQMCCDLKFDPETSVRDIMVAQHQRALNQYQRATGLVPTLRHFYQSMYDEDLLFTANLLKTIFVLPGNQGNLMPYLKDLDGLAHNILVHIIPNANDYRRTGKPGVALATADP